MKFKAKSTTFVTCQNHKTIVLEKGERVDINIKDFDRIDEENTNTKYPFIYLHKDGEEVDWCENRVDDTDIKYILDDNKTQSIKSIIQEFNKRFKCIEKGCEGDGVLPEQDGEGDWQPAQCEFCYEVRFPLKDWLEQTLNKYKQDLIEDMAEDNATAIRSGIDSYKKRVIEELKMYQSVTGGNDDYSKGFQHGINRAIQVIKKIK